MASRATVLQERYRMSLTLPPDFERAVRERVGTDRYETAWDVFASCVGASHRLASEKESQDWWRERHDALSVDAPRAHHERGMPPEFWIPRSFEVAVRQHLSTGRYASQEDVFDAFLAALREQEQWEDENVDWLRAQVQVGMDQLERGEGVDGEVAFARLRERFGGGPRP